MDHLSSMLKGLPRARSRPDVAVAGVQDLRACARLEVRQRGIEEACRVQGAGKDVHERLFFERKGQVGGGRQYFKYGVSDERCGYLASSEFNLYYTSTVSSRCCLERVIVLYFVTLIYIFGKESKKWRLAAIWQQEALH